MNFGPSSPSVATRADDRAHAVRVEVELGDLADRQAGDGHRAADGEAVDLAELGGDLVALLGGDAGAGEGVDDEHREDDEDEGADQDLAVLAGDRLACRRPFGRRGERRRVHDGRHGS
jgi:hypothetical protein